MITHTHTQQIARVQRLIFTLAIYRIGRSRRFGRKGVAINFVTAEDVRVLRDMEAFYNTQILEMPANVTDLL